MTLDQVSQLLLDEAALPDASPATGSILVIDDPALANHLHAAGHPVLAYCDDLRDERELGFPALGSLEQRTLADVALVLLRLPKSLGMLQDYAQRVAAFADPGVGLLAGGREKHLTRGMNEVLAQSFGTVRASLGRRKSRVLHAAGAIPSDLAWPHTAIADDLALISHAGAFAADRLDGGTRLLLQSLRQELTRGRNPLSSAGRGDSRPRGDHAGQGGAETTRRGNGDATRGSDASPTRASAEGIRNGGEGTPAGGLRAVDLGCGTGILATWLARQGYDVLAVDVSSAACASARDTASANDVRIEVQRADRLDRPASSIDLVVCNPPFHRGTTKDSTPGFELIRGAIPALAPDSEFWTVFNSHLPYLPFLRAEIGRTRVIARDRHYTVTRSTVRGTAD